MFFYKKGKKQPKVRNGNVIKFQYLHEKEKERLPRQGGQIPQNETRHQGKLQDKQESRACQPSIYAQLHLCQRDPEELIELLMPKLPLE